MIVSYVSLSIGRYFAFSAPACMHTDTGCNETSDHGERTRFGYVRVLILFISKLIPGGSMKVYSEIRALESLGKELSLIIYTLHETFPVVSSQGERKAWR